MRADTMEQRILVAGIGNIFLGDDAFGVEVAQRLAHRRLPDGVNVVDFGIRGFDLAFALLDDYAATIMIDAVQRGGEPGALYVIEPDLDEVSGRGMPAVETHNVDPVKVLSLVKELGGHPQCLYLIGCEPATLGEDQEDGYMGLSETVEAALEDAMELVESLIKRVQEGKPIQEPEHKEV